MNRFLIRYSTLMGITDKSMRENRREEARELMKWVLEKNDEVEPGRKVSNYVANSLCLLRNDLH